MKRIIHTAEQIIGKLEGADGMGECLGVGRTLARVEMSQKRTSFSVNGTSFRSNRATAQATPSKTFIGLSSSDCSISAASTV